LIIESIAILCEKDKSTEFFKIQQILNVCRLFHRFFEGCYVLRSDRVYEIVRLRFGGIVSWSTNC